MWPEYWSFAFESNLGFFSKDQRKHHLSSGDTPHLENSMVRSLSFVKSNLREFLPFKNEAEQLEMLAKSQGDPYSSRIRHWQW